MQQSLHSSTFQRDQEMMSAYLRHTSTVTADRPHMRRSHTGNQYQGSGQSNNAGGNDAGKPFEMASDDDLLNSNFDRISKILPNHEQINE